MIAAHSGHAEHLGRVRIVMSGRGAAEAITHFARAIGAAEIGDSGQRNGPIVNVTIGPFV